MAAFEGGDLPKGYFRPAGENETTIVSTKNDPPKHRLGVLKQYIGNGPDQGRGLGALSFNTVIEGGSEDEHVLIQGKATEDGQGGGEFYLGLKKPNGGGGDDAMVDVLTATVDGFQFRVPIYAPNLGTTAPNPGTVQNVTRMWAPDGLHFTQQQSDGNFVTYRTTVAFSIAPEHVTALWSAWTGKIG